MDDTTKPTIMIVEDDPDLRTILSFQLRSEGFEVETAENGEAGFQLLQQLWPHCVVLDLFMPVMDGFNFLKRIKSMESTNGIPVVVLTASHDERHRRKSEQYLADAFVLKPYDLQELTVVIKRLSRFARPVKV